MNKIIIFSFFLFLFSLTSCKKDVPETPLDSYKVGVIHEDHDGALNAAQANNKNVCIVFHANWCNICKTFIADVLTDDGVAQTINNKIVVSVIDGDNTYGKPYFNQYNASGFPTFIVLDKQGVEITRRTGGMNKTEFTNWISDYLK